MVANVRNFYRLTTEGRALWSRRHKVDMPDDYRRVLGLVEYCGYETVIRAHLARYPGEVIDSWLADFERMNLIEQTAAPRPRPPRVARRINQPPLDETEKRNIAHDTDHADISLSRLGVYVSSGRVSHRLPVLESPRSTEALVLEDDPDQLALAVLRLTNAGFPVRSADCVKAFFTALRKRAPDILFLDVMLPDGDGFDVLATLRNHATYALLPIVMVTAKTAPEDIAKGLALGADAYVVKPYGRNTLEYVLRYVLNQPLALPDGSAIGGTRAAAGRR